MLPYAQFGHDQRRPEDRAWCREVFAMFIRLTVLYPNSNSPALRRLHPRDYRLRPRQPC